MQKRATITDVAKKAGVAPSTVSFVLNNTKNQKISETTKQKILDCVEELGYVANFQARNIAKKTSQSRTIGVVMSYKLEHTYSHEIIHGLSEEAIGNGYGLLICGIDRDVDKNSTFIQYFLEGRIDGIIFISSAHSESRSRENDYIDVFIKYNIPFVVLYGYSNRNDASYINIDLKQGSRDATRFLVDKGLENLVYIGVLDKKNETSFLPKTEQDRIDGYKEVVITPEIIFLPRDFASMDNNDILEKLNRFNQVDGFITCWATIGIQLASWIKSTGRHSDARIIALDTLPYMEHTHRDILSVKLPFYELSKLGIKTIIHKLNSKKSRNEIIYCPCQLQNNY